MGSPNRLPTLKGRAEGSWLRIMVLAVQYIWKTLIWGRRDDDLKALADVTILLKDGAPLP